MTTIHTARRTENGAVPTTVEVSITPGIGIQIVGLADKALKESLLRTITALQASGYSIPGRKIMINISPADLNISGEDFDLAIAVGIVAASGQRNLPFLKDYVLAGRLGLDGNIYEVEDADAVIEAARILGINKCILPFHSALGSSEHPNVIVWGLTDLQDVLQLLEEGEDQ